MGSQSDSADDSMVLEFGNRMGCRTPGFGAIWISLRQREFLEQGQSAHRRKRQHTEDSPLPGGHGDLRSILIRGEAGRFAIEGVDAQGVETLRPASPKDE